MSTKNHFNIPLIVCLIFGLTNCNEKAAHSQKKTGNPSEKTIHEKMITVDAEKYDAGLLHLANGDTTGLWPVKPQPYPLKGAILPFKRIVAYYGNLYSKNMGILGEYPPKELWEKLHGNRRMGKSRSRNSSSARYPLHCRSGSAKPHEDGTYRMRMPENQIDSVLTIANMGNAIVFLDIQVGTSTVEKRFRYSKILENARVHLAIDPEFSMKDGTPRVKNRHLRCKRHQFCSDFLVRLVQENNLPSQNFCDPSFYATHDHNYKQINHIPKFSLSSIWMDGVPLR